MVDGLDPMDPVFAAELISKHPQVMSDAVVAFAAAWIVKAKASCGIRIQRASESSAPSCRCDADAATHRTR